MADYREGVSRPTETYAVTVLGALDSSGVVHALKVDGSGNLDTTGGGGGGGGGASTIADGADVAEGATTDAVVAAGAAGTISAKLRRLTTDLSALLAKLPSALGQQLDTASLGVVLPADQVTALGQATSGNSVPVTLASDQIGTAGTAAAAVVSIQGVASMTPVQVDHTKVAGTAVDVNSGNKSAGTMRVVLATDQPQLTNKLLVTPDANSAVNVAQLAGTTTDTNSGNKSAGTLRVVLATDQPALTNALLVTPGGNVAHDGVDSGNPLKIGGKATTSQVAAVSTDLDRVDAAFDIYGRQLVSYAPRAMKGTQQTTITSSTGQTTIVTADATYKLDIFRLVIANKSGTACNVTIKDATSGTTRYIFAVAAGATVGFSGSPDAATPQAAANNNWTATCDASVDSIYITADYVKNL